MTKIYLIIASILTCNYANAQSVKTVNQKGGKTSLHITNIQNASNVRIGDDGIAIDGKKIQDMPRGQQVNIYITGDINSVYSEMGSISVTGSVGNATTEMGNIQCPVINGNAHSEMGNIIKCK